MLMTNTVLAHISCRVDILRVTSAAIREQDHGAGAHSVHVTRNRTGAGPVQSETSLAQGRTAKGDSVAGNSRCRQNGRVCYVGARFSQLGITVARG